MRSFQFMIWVVLVMNIYFISSSFWDLTNDYNAAIEQVKKGYGNYAEYNLYKTFMYKDSLGVSKFEIATDVGWVKNKNSLANYNLNNGFRVQEFYEHSNLGTRMTIGIDNYIKLNKIGDWIIIFYRSIYLIIGLLILSFIRGVIKGRIFARQTIHYIKLVGVIVLLCGFLLRAKNIVVSYILNQFCNIEFVIINTNFFGNSIYLLIGIFLIILSLSFSRGYYLEKQNDLTI